eukprot:8562803-Alexandrium_andersonii.AAC.1
MVGQPAKALGVYLPKLRAVPADNEAKVTKACQEARRAAHLPCAWWHRRQVVAGGVTPALAWALVTQPLRKVDHKLFNSAVRMGVCNGRWVSASADLVVLMVSGHNSSVLYQSARRLDALLSAACRRCGPEALDQWLDAAPFWSR